MTIGKEKSMKRLGDKCIDCGCEAESRVVDEEKPLFRMEIAILVAAPHSKA